MSRAWYEGVPLPPSTMVVDAQDLVDFWVAHPKEFWDVAVDYPFLTPPAASVFLVGAVPDLWIAKDSPWGVHFEAVDIHTAWTGRHSVGFISTAGQEPDEFVLDGEEVKQVARWKVIARAVQPSATVREVAAWRYMVRDDGSLAIVRGQPYFGPRGRDVEALQSAGAWLGLLQPMLLVISAWNEGVAHLERRLRPPRLRLTLRRGHLPTIGQQQRGNLAS